MQFDSVKGNRGFITYIQCNLSWRIHLSSNKSLLESSDKLLQLRYLSCSFPRCSYFFSKEVIKVVYEQFMKRIP